MDIYNTLIGLLLLVVSFAPFVILTASGAKKSKKIKQEIEAVAKKSYGTIVEFGHVNNLAFAIDAHNNYFYIRKENNIKTYRLSNYTSCNYYEDRQRKGNGKNRTEILVNCGLELIAKSGLNLKVECYSITKKIQPSGEYEFAQKWSKLIQDRL